MSLVNSTTDTQKSRLRERTDRAWCSRLVYNLVYNFQPGNGACTGRDILVPSNPGTPGKMATKTESEIQEPQVFPRPVQTVGLVSNAWTLSLPLSLIPYHQTTVPATIC